jgi:flagella basal body P-ring formation protein FlgA
VEAAEVLESAKPIAESQLVLKKGPRFPFDAPAINSLDVAAGRRPVRTLASGTAITAAMLLAPHDVERGETVRVEVLSGGAMLELDATAETAGSAGESIILRNPQSGKRFTAKIQGKGKVLVER